ncbi:hypothetical protein DPMN_024924 [Dreissena polymorpha]|uniref:Uncharacterized protein n=1 Tax=Dreissena polymorpha TaxID=45954 RepID=A0A9D4LSB2_DREPO|nr:hypothetical protein DPMN_024924 [Dreissena polymorpha]
MQSDHACIEAVQGPGCGDCYRQLIPESDGCWEEVSVKVFSTEWDEEAYISSPCRDTVAGWRYKLTGTFIK